MNPSLALLLWLIFLVALLRFDPAKAQANPAALWIPVIWFFIVATRLPSQWFGGFSGTAASALEEGNSLDRTILSALSALALGVLMSRSFKWGDFFGQNLGLTILLSFDLLSVVWSDFPFVALKRWIRDFGNYLVILVAVSDPRPLDAFCTVFRRLFYFLMPLNILLVKYYPGIGRTYDAWTGTATYSGATTSKNMLGVMCLVSALFFFWDTLTRWRDRKERLTRRVLLLNVLFLAMTIWLLNLSASATSRVCAALGCAVMLVAHTKTAKRHLKLLKVLIPGAISAYVVLVFGLGVELTSTVAAAVGRDPTLTDRTHIWKIVLSLGTNPILGTGYESFWLGSRLLTIWQAGFGHLNEAHNGYLQTYLNLGLVGDFVLICFLVAGYRRICRRLTTAFALASLSLGLWTVLLFYNFTEVGFQAGLPWLMLMSVLLALPVCGQETHKVHPL